jgi:glycosyltransferase involved in cell wall biosynthesis
MPLSVDVYDTVGAAIPEVALIVPVHNQEKTILRNLRLLREHAALAHEIVVIVDGCTDSTAAVVSAWAMEATKTPSQTVKVTIVTIPDDVFETLSDSIGISLSTAPFVIEVQADMSISHSAFDAVLVRILSDNSDVFAISGRGAHTLSQVTGYGRAPKRAQRAVATLAARTSGWLSHRFGWYGPSLMEHRLSDSIGRVGVLVELPVRSAKSSRLYLHETVMRGPLAFSRAHYDKLGGFDTESFFLGNDDHDLVFRAWRELGLSSAYFPIAFMAPLAEGTTRVVKSKKDEARFQMLKEHYRQAEKSSSLLKHGNATRPRTRNARRAVVSGDFSSK